MLGKLARAAYMLIVATMIVAWAFMPGNNSQAAPQQDQRVEYWYC
jgi:hypothetical protein